MTKDDLRERVDQTISDTKAALQTVYDALNKGQRQKLGKTPEVKALLERYGVGGE